MPPPALIPAAPTKADHKLEGLLRARVPKFRLVLDAGHGGWDLGTIGRKGLMEKDLVLDENPMSTLVGVGPEVPLITSYESHAIVNDLAGKATGFPVARSLEIKDGAKAKVAKLFATSKNSFATFDLHSAEIKVDPAKDKKGPFTLAVAGTLDTGKQSRFVVVGNSRWASNSFLRFNGNRNLLLNMLNWLSSDEDLISIRPKEQEDRRLNLTRAQFLTLRAVSQFILPLIVIVCGVMVWWRRR